MSVRWSISLGHGEGLLGRHVPRGADDVAAAAEVLAVVQRLGEAEVGELRLVVLVDQDVRGLDVAVDDGPGVRRLQGPSHLGHEPERTLQRQLGCPDEAVERGTVDVFHHEVVERPLAADVVDLEDVRVRQLGRGPGLALEPQDLFGAGVPSGDHDLDRDGAFQPRLAAEIDDAHRPDAQLADRDVLADPGGCRKRLGEGRLRTGDGGGLRRGPSAVPCDGTEPAVLTSLCWIEFM